jgi:hypothetical protein
MINAIYLLKMEAQCRRRMTTPNAHTITEHAAKENAKENAKLADEYEVAAEALRKLHNEGFGEGVMAGMKSLAESCKARREAKSETPERIDGATR